MKKALALFLLLCLALTACSPKLKDFRFANWGATRTQVKNSETAEFSFAEDDLLLFETKIDEIDAEIYYHFEDDSLTSARISFLIRNYILDDFIAHYETYAQELIQIYGQPLNADYRVWLTDDPSYRADRDAAALLAMNLEYRLEWVTETSYVSLTLDYRDLQAHYYHYACDIALYNAGKADVASA